MSVSPVSVAEAGGTATVTVSTGGVTFPADQTIELGLSGTASKGADYTIASENPTLTAGSATVTTTVTAEQDTVDESAETVVVTASRGGGIVGTAQTITIIDDDTASWTVSVSPATVAEAGGQSTVRVSSGGVTYPTDQTITLTLAGTATRGADYTIASENLTLTAGSATVTTTVTAVQDTVDESAETVVVTASRGGGIVGTAQTITIIDDDTARGFVLSTSPAAVSEGAGLTAITVTATAKDGIAYGAAQAVTVSVGSGTATNGSDFAAVSDFTLTVPAESASASWTFDLAPSQDSLVEADETVSVSGSMDSGTVEPTTLTIIDDDHYPEVTISFTQSYSERGLALSLHTARGPRAVGGGLDALLDRQTRATGLVADDDSGGRLEVELGYGFPAFADRFTGTPWAGFGLSEGARDWRLGWRLSPAGRHASYLRFGIEAQRRESADDDSSVHSLRMNAAARW